MIDDTQELPVVRARRRSRGTSMLVGLLVGVALVAIVAVAGVVLLADNTADDSTALETGDEDPVDGAPTAVEPTAGEPTAGEAPVVETLPNESAGLWQVVGADRLNVRSGPGTSADVIGSLAAGDRGIYATGERATVNGGEWKRISFGGDNSYGWVSAGYLVPDTGEPEPEPEPEPESSDGGALAERLERGPACFLRQTGSRLIAVRLELVGDRQVDGFLREDTRSASTIDSIDATFAGEALDVILIDATDGSERETRWTWKKSDLSLADGTKVVSVPCVDVDSLLP